MRTTRRLAAIATVALLAIVAPSTAIADDEALPLAPAAPEITSAPPSPDNDLAPAWSFTAAGIASFECALKRGSAFLGDWAPCVSPAAYDVSAQADGIYTFAVRARGAGGTLSDVATADYRLDTRVPALPTIVSLPGPAAANRTPEWSFSGGPDKSFECRVDRGTDKIAGWSPCSSPHQVDLRGEPDGAYVLSIRGVAATGARGPARTNSYLLDTQPPAGPRLTSSPPAVDNAPSVTLAFVAEPDAQVECRIGSDDWGRCTSPHTFDLAGRPDGAYVLELRATDAAGNIGAATRASYSLDTTAPEAPAVDPPDVTPATKLQPAFTFAVEADTTYECRLPGPDAPNASWQPCTSPSRIDLTGRPDGTYRFVVRGTDAAGNTGPSSIVPYKLSRDPQAVDLSTGPGRIGKGRQPRWSFAVSGGSPLVCSLALDVNVLFKPDTCSGSREYDLGGKPDGIYVFTVGVSGNGAGPASATQKYELDSTRPAAPVTHTTPVSPSPDRKPTWRFTGEDGAALECRVTLGGKIVADWLPPVDGKIVSDWRECTTARKLDLSDEPDGDYTVSVRVRDAARNFSSATMREYTLDTTPPAAPTLDAGPKAEDNDRSPTWEFSGESDAVYSCTLTRGSEVVEAKSACAESKTYNLSGAAAGAYTFSVEAIDTAGNVSEPRTATYVLAKGLPPAPPLDKPPGGGGGSSGSAGGDQAAGRGTNATPTGGGGEPRTGDTPAAAPAAATSTTPGTGDGAQTATDRPRSSADTTRTAHSPAAMPAEPRGSRPVDRERPGERGPAPAGTADGRRGRAVATEGDAARRAGGGDHDRGLGDVLRDALGDARREAVEALGSDVAKVVFPIWLLVALGTFLLVQSRIDRSDPKLAAAPIEGESPFEFGPPPTLR